MFRFNASVRKRLQTRRLQRLRQRQIEDLVIDDEHPNEIDHQSKSGDDDTPPTGIESINVPIASSSSSSSIVFNPVLYNTDSFHNVHLEEADLLNTEESPLLFDGSPVSVPEVVRTLSACHIDFCDPK